MKGERANTVDYEKKENSPFSRRVCLFYQVRVQGTNFFIPGGKKGEGKLDRLEDNNTT